MSCVARDRDPVWFTETRGVGGTVMSARYLLDLPAHPASAGAD